MERSAAEKLLHELGNGWEIASEQNAKGVEHDLLRRNYKFKNFREALDFTNKVGELAEEQQHHPDLHLSWGSVMVEIWTHKIAGLTESDFVFAAKTEKLSQEALSS